MFEISSLVLAGLIAVGDPAPRTIEVAVDRTVEVEVGILIGFYCDHPKLIDAQMVTRKDERGERNVFVVKGVAAGKTQCRVGSNPMLQSQLFDVLVTATPPR
jgi:hypothetical protein